MILEDNEEKTQILILEMRTQEIRMRTAFKWINNMRINPQSQEDTEDRRFPRYMILNDKEKMGGTDLKKDGKPRIFNFEKEQKEDQNIIFLNLFILLKEFSYLHIIITHRGLLDG